MNFKKFFNPEYDDMTDYNTNSKSYYDYISKIKKAMQWLESIVIKDNKRQINVNDTNSIDLTKTNDWHGSDTTDLLSGDDEINISADVKISSVKEYGLPNAIHSYDDGLFTPDYTEVVNNIMPLDYNSDPSRMEYYTSRNPGGQDIVVIDDLLLQFEGGNSDHTGSSNVDVRNLKQGYGPTGAMYQLDSRTHNLGHVNGIDFAPTMVSGYISMSQVVGNLIAYNGAGLPPEITMLEGITKDTTDFNINNGINIKFKEGNKVLDGDGSVCFAGDYKTIFMTRIVDKNTIGIRRVLLGLGTNDLSDKTEDKSDMNSWGSFLPNKGVFNYNGTARILSDIQLDTTKLSNTLDSNQPQGMTYYNDILFIGIGFHGNNVISVKLHQNKAYIIDNIYPSNDLGIGGETEGVTIYKGQLLVRSSPDNDTGQKLPAFFKYNIFSNGDYSVSSYKDQQVYGSKEFINKQTFDDVVTFKKPITGVLNGNISTFKDINTVTNDMTTYQGCWSGSWNTVTGLPNVGYFNMVVTPFFGNSKSGTILLTPTGDPTLHVYMGIVQGGVVTWKQLDN